MPSKTAISLAYLPLIPLLTGCVILLFWRRKPGTALPMALLSIAATAWFGFRACGDAIYRLKAPVIWNVDWFQVAGETLRLGVMNDPLTACTLAMVIVVGFLVLSYSASYMEQEARSGTFFGLLTLFLGAMLGLVVSNSLLLLFIFWEIMGVASFLLIGFWYEKPSAAAAAQKAFLVTRVGDLGLLAGMAWLSNETGTLLFYDNGQGLLEGAHRLALQEAIPALGGWSIAAGIGLLIFWGAMGKSGQVPLHGWLPDAMEGPTPVSALIHAATMVASGVFLMARLFPIFDGSLLLPCMAWVGAGTALYAGITAVGQVDIKRVLAWSTISQLGFMIAALGCGSPEAAMFHLLTHGFFKALLFLATGAVIHACDGQQNLYQLGGIQKYMKFTWLVFMIGYFSLAGMPFITGGFYSKEAILSAAWENEPVVFWVLWVAVWMTGFYMTRMACLVFGGKYRGRPIHAHKDVAGVLYKDGKPSEVAGAMRTPMVVLALLSLPWLMNGAGFSHWLIPQSKHSTNWIAMALGIFAVLGGLWTGKIFYFKTSPASISQDPLLGRLGTFSDMLRNGFGLDSALAWLAEKLGNYTALLSEALDTLLSLLIQLGQGIVHFAGQGLRLGLEHSFLNAGFDFGCGVVRDGGRLASRLQTGSIASYLRIMAGGLAVLGMIIWMVARHG